MRPKGWLDRVPLLFIRWRISPPHPQRCRAPGCALTKACRSAPLEIRLGRHPHHMKRTVLSLAFRARQLALVGGASLGRHARHREAARHAGLRLQHRPRRLRAAGCAGCVDRLRHRLLPRHRRRDLQRSQQGQVRSALRQGPLHRALQSGEVDVLDPQHDLDAFARHDQHGQLRRRELLRRPGLHGQEVASRSPPRRSFPARPCACSRARRPSSTSRTSSAPTTSSTSRWPSPRPTIR